MTLRSRLVEALAADGPASSDYDLNPDVRPVGPRLREAAVLIPVVVDRAAPSVILTKRSSALKHHPGQISFPGGKVEDTDESLVAAALREACEEIGLEASDVDVLGTLSPHETVTGFTVTPVLSVVSPSFVAIPETGEVAEVFEVPLAHVTDPNNYLVESRMWRGQKRSFYTVPYGPYYVWGATARMLRALADRMRDAN